MNRKYLGDSYDAVKRLWQQSLLEWAPLYAEPRFIPDELRSDFTKMTHIPVLGSGISGSYSVLNDPDTGVQSPESKNQRANISHASLAFIRSQVMQRSVRCVVTFDQSKHRKAGAPPEHQRAAKLSWLQEQGVAAFYYVSHAPFLFACSTLRDLRKVASLVSGAGVPKARLQWSIDAQPVVAAGAPRAARR